MILLDSVTELFIRFTLRVFRERLYVWVGFFPFLFRGSDVGFDSFSF